MTIKETAEAFLTKINTLDILSAAPYCADNFTYSGVFPKPINLQEWNGTAAMFRLAFPDWNFNAKIEGEDANVVHIKAHVTGTHTGDLDLSMLGMGFIPATGKSVALPETSGRLTFEGDKIVNFHFEEVGEGGGIPGILAQLGVSG